MIKIDIEKIEKAPDNWSEVFDYREDLEKLDRELEPFRKYKNVIVVGNGGSISSYDAYCAALNPSVQTETVWTMDPALLNRVKKRFDPNKTIVIAVSKSGNTLGQMEALLYFIDFPVLVVTNPNEGTLSELAKKLGWHVIPHPSIGGRFSGGTSSTLVGASLVGLNSQKILEGIVDGYEKLRDTAYTLSKYYFDLDEKGFSEVYVTCYCEPLKGFGNLIVQLMHESVCKEEKGQTFYFAMGPEAQHHTNQRFLGGRKNVVGTFIVCQKPKPDIKLEINETIKDVDYKGDKLSVVDGISYSDLLDAEYLGTKGDADEKSVPNVTITIDEVNEKTVGQMVSFWHMVAFYSSVLRGVNAFDQPAVERSKNITLDIIKNLK
ncbi:MAG: hypothetical protein NTZ65_01740 [Candidatus Berkelbacteria bacterium]|nr:hypothetical protein [Candidatus Berkelbacteria bacterium]